MVVRSITTQFMNALRSVDSAVGLSTACSTYLVKPISNAWLQARKLHLDSKNNVLRDENTGQLSFYVTTADGAQGESSPIISMQERGILNKKIDNIVNSVMTMRKDKISNEQIGEFVSNSVELILATSVVAVGGVAGGVLGGVAGAATGGFNAGYGSIGGAFKSVAKASQNNMKKPNKIIMVGPQHIAGVATVGALVEGAKGAYKGAGKGADYASKFLGSPKKLNSDRISEIKNKNTKDANNKNQEISAGQAIAKPLVEALNSLNLGINLSAICEKYIVEPVRTAWLQARKLHLDSKNNVLRDEDTGQLSFYVATADGAQGESSPIISMQERGILNKKIDNIVNSVMTMHKNKISNEQIGEFVSNSVELILATSVVAVGGVAGGALGGVAGAATGGFNAGYGSIEGALKSVAKASQNNMKKPNKIIMVGPQHIAGVATVGALVEGAKGAYKGAGKGADYASKFLGSSKKLNSDRISEIKTTSE